MQRQEWSLFWLLAVWERANRVVQGERKEEGARAPTDR